MCMMHVRLYRSIFPKKILSLGLALLFVVILKKMYYLEFCLPASQTSMILTNMDKGPHKHEGPLRAYSFLEAYIIPVLITVCVLVLYPDSLDGFIFISNPAFSSLSLIGK